MEILGDLSFLSKYKIHLNIDNGNISITLEGNDDTFNELKSSLDKLKVMEKYKGFGLNFDDVTLTNITLTKNFYGRNVHGSLKLKENSQ